MGLGGGASLNMQGKAKWNKLHLVLDLRTGHIILSKLGSEHQHDTTYFEEALLQANGRKGKVLMDGIADNKKCYELAKKYNKELLTPLQKRAVILHEPIYEKRNEAVRIIKGLGKDLEARSIWGKLTGYSQRSVVESMMSRWKRAFGGSLKSRCLDRRQVEIQIKSTIFNQMVDQKEG